jgi:hypothetical protein
LRALCWPPRRRRLRFAVSAFVHDGWTSALLRGATWFVLGIALWTFLWTYASLQLGLDRLGRERLSSRRRSVKARELAIARELYAQAYEPVHTAPTLEALERQRHLLGAADALEKRAHAIHEWPIDEGTFARVITIATSVVAITVARLILDPLGLDGRRIYGRDATRCLRCPYRVIPRGLCTASVVATSNSRRARREWSMGDGSRSTRRSLAENVGSAATSAK